MTQTQKDKSLEKHKIQFSTKIENVAELKSLEKTKVEAGATLDGTEREISILSKNIGKVILISTQKIGIQGNVRTIEEEDPEEFAQLVSSIKEHGVMQNVTVQFLLTTEGYELNCVAGKRRLTAAKTAGLEKIPCLIVDSGDAEKIASMSLDENLHRKDLHPLEIAEGFLSLTNQGWSEERIAKSYEKADRTVRRYLKIGTWPEDVRMAVRQHAKLFTARVLLLNFVGKKFETNDSLRRAIKSFIEGSDNKTKADPKPEKFSATQRNLIRNLNSELNEKLKVKISLKGKPSNGKIEISVTSETDFEQVVNYLKATQISL